VVETGHQPIPAKNDPSDQESDVHRGSFLSAMLAASQCKADSPSYIPLTAYDFCNLRAAHVSRLLWGSLISHQNDEFAHTYPLVDRPTLEKRRSGRRFCGNCSYVQMVSGNR
jgi:hypothetical protein